MRKVEIVKSVAAPLLSSNIDTDIIMPMERVLFNLHELEKFVFEPLRFIDGDGDRGELNPDFPLNKPAYKDAKIMIVGENFGCGGSREQGVQAMAGIGIECVIGSSFGGIFYKNCFQQGILPISLAGETVAALAEQTLEGEFVVNLYEQTITTPRGEVLNFEIEPIRKELLLAGLDDVGYTLTKRKAIETFRAKDKILRPWVYSLNIKK